MKSNLFTDLSGETKPNERIKKTKRGYIRKTLRAIAKTFLFYVHNKKKIKIFFVFTKNLFFLLLILKFLQLCLDYFLQFH